MNLIERIHERHVRGRRVRALADTIAPLFPPAASILDVGCGDGQLAEAVLHRRRDISILGFDVLVRPDARIPVQQYDGIRLPLPESSVDVVMFVDVLHHTLHARALLREARRVARRAVVLKDHAADGFLAHPTLRFMDKIGNTRFGVALPHIYLRWAEWLALFGSTGLHPSIVQRRLGLYPRPLTWVFERSLHFVAVLETAE